MNTLEEMNQYMQSVIVPARSMEVELVHWENGHVELTAPLNANTNHAGTGFGGSISSLLLLCGWAAVKKMMQDTDSEALIVVKTSTTEYLRPVTEDFSATPEWPEEDVLQDFTSAYREQGRGDLTLTIRVHSAGKVCAVSKSHFVVRRKRI